MSHKTLSPFQKKRVMDIIGKIQSCELFREIFYESVLENFQSTSKELFSKYKGKIKTEMYLKKVIENVNSDKYSSIKQWKEDMDLIGDNCIKFWEDDDQYLVYIAKYYKFIFKDLTKYVTDDPLEDWKREYYKLSKKMYLLLRPSYEGEKGGRVERVEKEKPERSEKPDRHKSGSGSSEKTKSEEKHKEKESPPVEKKKPHAEKTRNEKPKPPEKSKSKGPSPLSRDEKNKLFDILQDDEHELHYKIKEDILKLEDDITELNELENFHEKFTPEQVSTVRDLLSKS